jgi:hypothetical protein
MTVGGQKLFLIFLDQAFIFEKLQKIWKIIGPVWSHPDNLFNLFLEKVYSPLWTVHNSSQDTKTGWTTSLNFQNNAVYFSTLVLRDFESGFVIFN